MQCGHNSLKKFVSFIHVPLSITTMIIKIKFEVFIAVFLLEGSVTFVRMC